MSGSYDDEGCGPFVFAPDLTGRRTIDPEDMAGGGGSAEVGFDVSGDQPSLDQITRRFHQPIKEAARSLGISLMGLKQLCRKYGVEICLFSPWMTSLGRLTKLGVWGLQV
jgi:hypothetical protein